MNTKKTPEEKAAAKENRRQEFQSQQFKRGGYSISLSALALAIVIFVNLLVGKLPSTITKPDISKEGTFTLSDATKTAVKNLAEPVTFYLLAETGAEDTTIKQLLERYDELSANLDVQYVDPVQNPYFSQQYTTATLAPNSVIAVSEKRSLPIDYSEIYVTEYVYDYSINNYNTETNFDGENAFTSAIDYVTSDTLPTAYLLTGHGEGNLPQSLKDSISRQNILLNELNLAKENEVPDNAACLFICSPSTDLSADETDKILSYLDAGGKLLLITDYTKEEMPNLASIGAFFGLHKTDGIVIEGDQNHSIYNFPQYLFPIIANHEITDPIVKNNYSILMPIVQGIEEDETHRSTLTITPLLTTSNQSYSKISALDMKTTEKEPGDIDGPFNLCMLATEYLEDRETELIWFGGSSFLAEQVDSTVSGANTDLFLNALSYLCEKENSITIHAKDSTAEQLTIPASGTIVWGILLAVILPLATVIYGTVIWRKRRKRV